MPNITIPHLFTPRDYQIPLLRAMDEGVKRAVIVYHRRSGKDKTCLQVMIKKAVQEKGAYYYFFPTYTQAKKVLWDGMDKAGMKFLDHIPKEIIVKKNETEMSISLINGSIIQLVGCDKIDSIVGTNPRGVIFSEFSISRPNVWDYIRPILAENNGWAIFNFTPRGMNHGWKILQQAKQNGWFHEELTVDDTHAIDEETLAKERAEMPQDLFDQEYYVKFIEGAGALFRKIQENVWSGDLCVNPKAFYRLGVDLGKHQDFTVITPINTHTWQVGKQERFNQIDWTVQKDRIIQASKNWNNAPIVLDSTGLGDPIYDDLLKAGLTVESFKFTAQTREQLVRHLSVLLEQGLLKIPNDDMLIGELRSFVYQLTERGTLTMGVPDGLHDDMVMSLALAFWNLWDKRPERKEPKKIPVGSFEQILRDQKKREAQTTFTYN
jgi:hypothetical protein